MVIERGADWGVAGELSAATPESATDQQLASAIAEGQTHVRPTAGDLASTLGVTQSSLARPVAMLLPIDAIEVTIDSGSLTAAAHVLVGPQWRPSLAVMNAAFVGHWNLAPRAHPGDGRLDVVILELGLVEWFKARRRLVSGTHLPHPGIAVKSVREWTTSFDRPQLVRVDGRLRGKTSSLQVKVIDEAIVAGV